MTVDERIWSLGRYQFAELVKASPPHLVATLMQRRFAHKIDEFCRYLWPDRFTLAFSPLHDDLFRTHLAIPPYTERVEDERHAIAAPRGYAKSTIVSFAEIVHDVVYDREAYIILLSATQRLSLTLSRDLRQQFLTKDSRLSRLYGPFEVQGGVGEWEVSVQGRPSVGILARSFGTEVRGSKHPTRGIRPTKAVIDDGERKDRVRNPEQRAIWWDALTKDILKLGRREGGLCVVDVGTILHPDSKLARQMTDPGWVSKRWQAIKSWPVRADLWERCRQIWADLTLGKHRRAAALAFYAANQAEMDAGAELLDPAAKSLFQLHELIWSEGLASFLSELQNEPIDPSAQIFWSERFARFRLDGDELVVHGTGRRVKLRDLRLSARWDPAMGLPGGDFAAIAVIGRDKHGYSYVLDVWMRRVAPHAQLAAAWVIAERWGLRRMRFEDNGFQDLVTGPYRRERNERREQGRYWQLTLEGDSSTDDKQMRISTLEPDVTNGWMLFNENIPSEVFQQFDQFPTADHDDGPDVIHAAWKDSGASPAHMETRRAGEAR